MHHRDIKLENLMLSKGADGELTVKLADFGLSDLRVLPFDLSGTFCGSPLYAAPELMTTGACPDGYDASRSDIYSCGVVLYALLASCLPFDADDIHSLVRMIQEGTPSAPVPKARGEDASELVLSMMQVDPAARPTAAEVLAHAWSVMDTSQPAIKEAATHDGALALEAATVGTTLTTNVVDTLQLLDSSFDTEAAAVEDNSGSDLPELPAMTRASSLPAHRRGETTALVRVTLTLTLTLPNPNLMTLRRGASETTAFFKSMRAKVRLPET